MSKKTVALTGASGTMGFQSFLELYAKKDEFDIVLLIRDSEKNRKKFAKYMNDPAVRFVWGDLTSYEDVLAMVSGADYVLHVGGMVSPAADYFPTRTLKTNVTAAENIVRAVKAQPDPDAVKVVYIGTVAETGDRNPPIHWARTGDPIKISVYDHYAISKVKAEAIFAESGLKYWVSLRQSGILYPAILKNMEPIMYHVPMNGVLEWATVEDAGRLMANV
ncbi:MAG: NAD(P)-dependent oxidoreductase, partial [Firmicutes bacterium]|nr:NAD(P)-dependent oxidoreductase [Bacillota bacterium]